MAIEKKFSTIHLQKHDLEVNWLQVPSFIPKNGELIIYDPEVDAEGIVLKDSNGKELLPEGRTAPYMYSRIKIGDGINTLVNLPFNNGNYLLLNDLVTNEPYQLYVSNGSLSLSKVDLKTNI